MADPVTEIASVFQTPRSIDVLDFHLSQGVSRHQVESKAEFSGSIENLICEMNKMLCRGRKTSVTSVCGQVDQPLGQGKWANERAHQSVDMAHMHDADLRVVTPSRFPRVWRPLFLQRSVANSRHAGLQQAIA
jgi:hypothetical protein